MKKVASFEKVSYKEFEKAGKEFLEAQYVNNLAIGVTLLQGDNVIKVAYDTIEIPKRATKGSAGHDFVTPFLVSLAPKAKIAVPTGIRCKMDKKYVLQIYPRSSMGVKYDMFISNTVGIIDSDYYNADNEGHIFIKIENRGLKHLTIDFGQAFAQGLFIKYAVADDEEVTSERTGGWGSTDKGAFL